jgi:type II secretory pathway component PulF
MTAYRCLTVSAEGRTDWRTVDAPSQEAAISRLGAGGLTAIEVRSGKASLAERLNQPVKLRRGIGLAEQSLVLTQLALLVQSGLPVDRSLDLLREQAPRAPQRALLAEVLAQVRAGRGLASGFEDQNVFPVYVVGVIRSAERAGRLGEALDSVAHRMSRAAATRRQLVMALTYPAAILVATLLALMLVLLVVVPQFEPVFAGEEQRLPTLTRAVLAASGVAIDHGLFLLIGLVACFTLLWLFLRSGRARLGAGFRKIVPGMRLRDQYLAGELMGLLATLLGNGVSVLSALRLARAAMNSPRWQTHLAEVEQRVREGASLSRALKTTDLIPRTAVRLMEVGERSGKLAETCQQASTVLGDAARARIERAVSLANPIAIVSLGGVVALLVAGVMLGIFAMGDFAG